MPTRQKYLILSMLLGTPLLITSGAATPEPAPVRERLSLDVDWRFHLGDMPMPEIKGHGQSYNNAKAGVAWGAAAPTYDDRDWRLVNVPHDWVVEGPFDKEANMSQGYRPRGIAWYRRHFRLDEADQGKHLELQFDGIATYATVWVNGLLAHRNHCGYTPFQIDITSFAKYGNQLNTIAVRVDAVAQEGWWYEGGGLYRHTWLVKRSPVQIETDGVYANPVRDPAGKWSVPVEVTLNNIETAPADTEIEAELLDPDGKPVVAAKSGLRVPVLTATTVAVPLAFPGSPRLWSLETPTLYSVRVTARREGRVLDQTSVRCGFRTLRFDADKGFFLNDQSVKLQGTCNHQDHAGVGVALPDALWDYRVRRLKEMGSNAYRAAHNPPAPEFLEACDRLGLLVMDENRNFNPTPEYISQLRSLIRRDRNHPSVILWSVFNEEPMQGTPQAREMVRRMVAEVHRWDTTRPVTAAQNGGLNGESGAFQAVDVVGFNYQDGGYDGFHAKYPKTPITSSEDTSAFMTRGEFESDKSRNVITSYDDEAAGWGNTHRKAWKRIATRPWLAGGFVWTGFDYRGEPQRLSWPSVSSVFGILDLCGFPKTAYYIHQADWVKDRPILALAPHWNWAGKEGKPVRVIAMTNGEKVALFLNGKPLGEKDRPAYDYIEWSVPYEPGKLEAVAYRAGKEIARTAVETTGPVAALTLAPDHPWLAGDGRDAQPITVSAVDAQGRVVPGSSNLVTFTVTGPGRNIGHGNGDHNCHDPEQGPTRRVFHGLAQLIVQSGIGSGPLNIRAESPGLQAAELTLDVRAVPVPPSVPAAEPRNVLSGWRVSPPQADRPDPATVMSEADMNTWAAVTPGDLKKIPAGQWVLYRVIFTPWKNFAEKGGDIRFGKLLGRAEIWLDGVKVAEKTTPASAPVSVVLPAKSGRRELTVLVQSDGDKAGLGDAVQITAYTL
jgi:beta-galactosidase